MEENTQITQNPPSTRSRRKRMSWKKWLGLLIIFVLITSSLWLYKNFTDSKNDNKRLKSDYELLQTDLKNLQAENQKLYNSTHAVIAKLLTAVAKLAQLPPGETPTVATVIDANGLKNQAFFAKAANGDRVLIFVQAQKAYLYRPSTNKIIEIAPLNFGTGQNL